VCHFYLLCHLCHYYLCHFYLCHYYLCQFYLYQFYLWHFYLCHFYLCHYYLCHYYLCHFHCVIFTVPFLPVPVLPVPSLLIIGYTSQLEIKSACEFSPNLLLTIISQSLHFSHTGRTDFGNTAQSKNPDTVSPPTPTPLPSSSATAESESSASQNTSPNIHFDRFTHLDADDFYIVKPSTESECEAKYI